MVWLETSSVPKDAVFDKTTPFSLAAATSMPSKPWPNETIPWQRSVDAHVVEKLSVEFVALGYKDVRVLYRLDDRTQICIFDPVHLCSDGPKRPLMRLDVHVAGPHI